MVRLSSNNQKNHIRNKLVGVGAILMKKYHRRPWRVPQTTYLLNGFSEKVT